MKDTLSLQAHLLLQATKQIAPNPAMSHSMGGNWIIKWAVIRLKGWRNSFYLSLQRHSSRSAGRF